MPATPPDEAALLALARLLRRGGYHHITPTPATHARVNARPGNRRAGTVADVFGWSRPFGDGVLPGPVLGLAREAGILEPDGDALRSTVRFSCLDGLMFAHSAYPTDAPDSVFFGPDTYRYGHAVAVQLARGPVRRAIDIGAGAGPGAILIARANPDAEVFAGDINDAALTLTRVNAALNDTPNVVARRSDLVAGVDGAFDLIVSNPPYLADPAQRAYRHGGGTFGEALSLAILDAALPRLAPFGTLLLYTGAAVVGGEDRFWAQAANLLGARDVDWAYREVDPDVFGEELDHGPYRAADRIAAVVLTATKTGTKCHA